MTSHPTDILLSKPEAQRALGESEARFRALFEGAGMCIMIVSLEGKVIECNAAAEKILGYSRTDLIGFLTRELIHPEDLELGMDLHHELLKGTRDHYQQEKRYIRKDGKTIWGQLTISLVRNKKGEPRFYIAIIDDVTERRSAVEALQKRETELKIQAQALEEVNVALRVLLKRRENDQREMEEKVLANVKELVFPFIQQLKKRSSMPNSSAI